MNKSATEVDKVISAWTARVLGDPKLAGQIGGVFKIAVHDGPSWIFDCRGSPRVEQGDGTAQCTVSLSADDLVALAAGNLNPQVAFLEGRLRVKGDLSLALRLEALFSGAH